MHNELRSCQDMTQLPIYTYGLKIDDKILDRFCGHSKCFTYKLKL